jgi:hypothetical protein
MFLAISNSVTSYFTDNIILWTSYAKTSPKMDLCSHDFK